MSMTAAIAPQCPFCHQRQCAAVASSHAAFAQCPDDVTLCGGCGAILFVDNHMALRAPRPGEIAGRTCTHPVWAAQIAAVHQFVQRVLAHAQATVNGAIVVPPDAPNHAFRF